MLSIAIFTDAIENMDNFRSRLQDFLIETETLAKVSYFNDEEKFITVPGSYDIYVMDMESSVDVIALSERMSEIDKGCHFIFLSHNKEDAFKIIKKHLGSFILRPADNEELKIILNKVKKKIKEENIIIKMSTYERRVRVINLNYIDIEKRCLCYHLADGNMFDGQTLRGSFEKAIKPLDEHPMFLFVSPSLLINVSNIKDLHKDHAVFDNDDIVYISKKAYDMISERWHKYNQ